MRTVLSASLVLITMAAGASAGSLLYIGNDTNGPVTVYTTAGVFVQNFGQSGATGSAFDAAGDVWTVAPGFGANNIVEYSPTQTVLNSFVASVGGQWIEDMDHGAGNTLWVSTYEGSVFAVNDTTGAILSSFAVPGSTYAGIAFDGTNLWVSAGLSSDTLFYYSTAGVLLNTIVLPTVCGGVGYDPSDNTLYCGDFGAVHHYSITGTLLGSFSTVSSNYHDGLSVENVASVPEPGSLLLIGTGLIGLAGAARRRRK